MGMKPSVRQPPSLHTQCIRCLWGRYSSCPWKSDLSQARLQPRERAGPRSAIARVDIRITPLVSGECLPLCTCVTGRGDDPAVLLALEFSSERARRLAAPHGRCAPCSASRRLISLSRAPPRKTCREMFLPWQREVAFSSHFVAYRAPFDMALQPTPLSPGVPPSPFSAA